MNRALARDIVGSLQASTPPGEHFARLPGASLRDWDHALEWLDHSGLALLFWSRLKELGEESTIPLKIGDRLEQNLEDHRARVVAMAEEFDSINRCFERANVKYAALKGLTIIPEYCSNIFLRTTYDYDYLLPRDSVEVAESALRAAGYVRKEDSEDHPIVYFHNARPPRSPLGRNDLYSATFPRTIELHYLFWDDGPLKIPLALPGNPLAHIELRHLSPMTNPSGQMPRQPIQFYALSDVDELAFQILHVFRHILHGWCRLYSLLDIAYFLNHRGLDAAFWNRFLHRLRCSRPLSEIAGVVFLLAAGVFGATIPEPVSVEIVRSLRRPLVLWVERYGQDSALSNFSDNKFSLFLHREFIQDRAAWDEIRRTRLFPAHRPNHVLRGEGTGVAFPLAASWTQGRYVVQRLRHHLMAAARYGLESPRWHRACSRDN